MSQDRNADKKLINLGSDKTCHKFVKFSDTLQIFLIVSHSFKQLELYGTNPEFIPLDKQVIGSLSRARKILQLRICWDFES